MANTLMSSPFTGTRYTVGETGPELFAPNRLYSLPSFQSTQHLHDGNWFIDRANAAARASTAKFMALVCVILILAKVVIP